MSTVWWKFLQTRKSNLTNKEFHDLKYFWPSTAEWLAVYLYWDEAKNLIEERKRLDREKYQKYLEEQKNTEIEWTKEEDLDYNEVVEYEEVQEDNSEENEKQDLISRLSSEQLELAWDEINEMDLEWLVEFKDFPLPKVQFIVNEIWEEIVDLSAAELKELKPMVISQIREYFW